jgi:hypothetical protein
VTVLLPVDTMRRVVEGREHVDSECLRADVAEFEASVEAGVPLVERGVSLREYERAVGILAARRAQKAQHSVALHKVRVGQGAGGKAASVWLSINCRDDQTLDWAGAGSAVEGETGERYSLLGKRNYAAGCKRLLLEHKVKEVQQYGGRALSTEAARQDHAHRTAVQERKAHEQRKALSKPKRRRKRRR